MRYFIVILIAVYPLLAQSQQKQPAIAASIDGHIFKPAQLEATDNLIQQLKVPAGFKIEKYAGNLEEPRMMAVNANGNVYVTNRKKGEILLLQDANQDGRVDNKTVVMKQDKVHGLAIYNNQLYAITVTEVFKMPIEANGTLGKAQKIIEDLPDGGQHANRTVYFGLDNKLYLTVGSTCNACDEPNDENATILQFNPDGSGRKIWAEGLRNTIGMDWHPQTAALWGMDHGIDWLGDEEQKEELNLLEEGKHYGWPYIYGDGKRNPADQPEEGYEAFEKKVTQPALLLTAHSAPMNFQFYRGSSFPAAYRTDAFATLHGSWNRQNAVGYNVVRVRFENGKPVGYEDFLTGFLTDNNKAQFGRPCGLAQLPDGSLLVTDDANGVIYRISYTGS